MSDGLENKGGDGQAKKAFDTLVEQTKEYLEEMDYVERSDTLRDLVKKFPEFERFPHINTPIKHDRRVDLDNRIDEFSMVIFNSVTKGNKGVQSEVLSELLLDWSKDFLDVENDATGKRKYDRLVKSHQKKCDLRRAEFQEELLKEYPDHKNSFPSND